ncbi:uncharacterized protein LOC128550257 [Mercenaria mercenaria]|uniref:uncharacterized protein LOC128550257 n=1 Tax=Mercenaria mercenaria TaxID=6596 RepID=UPI00234E757B|nr:uncharacterized protein LOC128550257 [Mercenaria mercenaria]
MCKFNPSTKEDFYYQVKWRIEGSSQITLTKQFFKNSSLDGLRLTESDFEDNDIGLGVNISCALRAFRTPDGLPGTLSTYSKPLFFGIEVLTPLISLRKGETKSVELLNSVPIICYTENKVFNQFIQSSCNVRLQYFSPQYGTCSSMPSFQDGCDSFLTNSEVGQITRVNISVAETGQYGVAGHFKIYLSVPAVDLGYLKLWRKAYKLPVISVDVLPETHTEWRGSICTARNDPHMYTFDQRTYEHHENGGEYIMYRHKFYTNVEIQHKVAPCTNENDKAKCNCGVAVRAGRDVYVINVCDNLLDIGHKHCGDEALTVKKDNDFTYTMYLPFGTAVRARIDNQPYMGPEGGKVLDISILPSVHDKGGNSTGLCGTLNNKKEDDFQHRDERIGTLKNSTIFIKSWRVLQNESLFTANVDSMQLEPWVFPMCTCKETEKRSPISCDRSVSDCTPGMKTGQHSCGEVSSRRSVRSLAKRPRIPLVRQTRHYEMRHKIIKRTSETKSWNNSMATRHCREYFSDLKTFKLCNKVPSTHTNVSEQNCVLDILLTNSSEWIDISRQSMLDTCQSEIQRNASVRQEVVEKAKNATAEAEAGLHTGTTILPPIEIKEIEELEKAIKTIKEIACLNDCSGHGTCSNGTCVCKQRYGASDCSLDIKKPPRLQEILDSGFYDEKLADCTHIYVFGEVFVGTNLTCRLKKFTMAVNKTRVNTQIFHTKGTAETLVEAMCPIEHLSISRRRRRSDNNQPPSDFVYGFEVSVSNDGTSFGNNTLDVYVFDSTCQSYTNGSMGMTFDLKDGYCHIEGKCVQNGTLSIKQTMICDSRAAKFRWTMVPTTTQAPVTANKASTFSEITKCGCNVNNTDSCLGTICKCKAGWTGLKCENDVNECDTDPPVCDDTKHSGCQNSPGSYNCFCLRNFRISEKGICEENTETDPKATIAEIEKSEPDQTAFEIEMTIDITLNSMHNLDTAETYQTYINETKNTLKQYYQKKLGIGLKDVVIISLRRGSLIVQHAVIVKSEDYVMKALSVAIATFSHGEKIELFGKTYSVHNVKVENNNVGVESGNYEEFIHCEIYTNLHPCEEHDQCVLENGVPICKRISEEADGKEGGTNLMIIISSTVGGVLVIIIFALVLVICCKRKKNKNRLENHQHTSVQNEYNDVTSREMVQIPRAKRYSDGKPAHDNPTFEHESRAMADTTLDSRSAYKEGSYCESKDGYVYYYGKK